MKKSAMWWKMAPRANQGMIKGRLHPDEDQVHYHLTQEGGHSHRRILHSADATGKAVTSKLVDLVLAAPNIQIFEHHCAVDLVTQADSDSRKIRCSGAYLLDIKTDKVTLFQAKSVVLASGGASKAYLYTSNPDGASGDGGRHGAGMELPIWSLINSTLPASPP